MNLEQVYARIQGLEALKHEVITAVNVQGVVTDDISDVSAEGEEVTVEQFLQYLDGYDALDSLFGGSATAEISDGQLFVHVPQGSKG